MTGTAPFKTGLILTKAQIVLDLICLSVVPWRSFETGLGLTKAQIILLSEHALSVSCSSPIKAKPSSYFCPNITFRFRASCPLLYILRRSLYENHITEIRRQFLFITNEIFCSLLMVFRFCICELFGSQSVFFYKESDESCRSVIIFWWSIKIPTRYVLSDSYTSSKFLFHGFIEKFLLIKRARCFWFSSTRFWYFFLKIVILKKWW